MRRLAAVFALRCPRCLKGRVWRRFVSMNPNCPECGFVFERESGYFAGAMVVSYALAVPILAAIVIALITLGGLDAVVALIVGNTTYLVLVPFIFRYSRVVWLHLDWLIDPGDGPGTSARS
ncbi:MAG TPA: DUF983 domain-containing protein [Candidatus Limnocylindria bacterium]|nr:DUF983 domain-containing protein [Candidatus Limnocylindria bacterium]